MALRKPPPKDLIAQRRGAGQGRVLPCISWQHITGFKAEFCKLPAVPRPSRGAGGWTLRQWERRPRVEAEPRRGRGGLKVALSLPSRNPGSSSACHTAIPHRDRPIAPCPDSLILPRGLLHPHPTPGGEELSSRSVCPAHGLSARTRSAPRPGACDPRFGGAHLTARRRPSR